LVHKRNVGILEKIVQSLGSFNVTTTKGTLISETIAQYEAQNHVLTQLEAKLQQSLRQQPPQLPPSSSSSQSAITNTNSTAIVKLRRDFERVQIRVSQLQEAATKKISFIQQQQNTTNSSNTMMNTNNFHNGTNTPYSNSVEMANGSGALNIHGSTTSSMDDTNVFEQHRIQQQLQIQEDRLHEEIMREREEEIRNINKGMHTVNEIYKDLAHIVGQQQHDIDKIEAQMEDSRNNAESGLKQVEKANEKYGQSNCSIM
jgi:hypothetical protein